MHSLRLAHLLRHATGLHHLRCDDALSLPYHRVRNCVPPYLVLLAQLLKRNPALKAAHGH